MDEQSQILSMCKTVDDIIKLFDAGVLIKYSSIFQLNKKNNNNLNGYLQPNFAQMNNNSSISFGSYNHIDIPQ